MESSILQRAFISTLEQMAWTEGSFFFFMGIQALLCLAGSPNYFWKLDKNAENLVLLLVMYSNVILVYLGQ